MSGSITVFLSARMDEREAGARLVLAFTARSRSRGISSTLWDEQDDDARMELREAEAVRGILARYEDCLVRQVDRNYSEAAAYDQAREYEDFVLPNLAAVHSAHPDYLEEWKP